MMSDAVYFGIPSVDEALSGWLGLEAWYENGGPGRLPFYRLLGAYLYQNDHADLAGFWSVVTRAVQGEAKINPVTREKALSNYEKEARIIFDYEAANR